MSSETQPVESRANDGQLEPLGLAICTLVGFAAIDGCVWGLLHSMLEHSPPEPVAIMMFLIAAPLVSAQVALAAIWLVYAWPPLPLRMLTALAPVVIVASLFWNRFSPREAQDSIVGLSWFTLALALPCGLARALGCEVRRFRTTAEQTEWLAVRRPRQFTLRQMFAWTSAAALLGGLGRVTTIADPTRAAEWFILALIALVCGGFAQAAVWSALGEKNPWSRLEWVAFFAFVVGVFAITIVIASAISLLLALVCPWTVLVTGGALMIFRANGFRYVRMRQPAAKLLVHRVDEVSNHPLDR